MEKKMGKKVEIKIVAEEAVQQGIYANMARISHSPEEITMDFIYVHHGPPFGKLRSRTALCRNKCRGYWIGIQYAKTTLRRSLRPNTRQLWKSSGLP